MPTLVLTVTGMSCGGCSGSVENVVKKVPGVAEVKAEFQPTNKVTVTGEDYDTMAIKEAIEKAGFKVEG